MKGGHMLLLENSSTQYVFCVYEYENPVDCTLVWIYLFIWLTKMFYAAHSILAGAKHIAMFCEEIFSPIWYDKWMMMWKFSFLNKMKKRKRFLWESKDVQTVYNYLNGGSLVQVLESHKLEPCRKWRHRFAGNYVGIHCPCRRIPREKVTQSCGHTPG